MKVIVVHEGYGCDTGCCGHAIYVNNERFRSEFEFGHADVDPKDKEAMIRWAKNFVREQMGEEHVKDLDWENCQIVTNSCDTWCN